MNAGVQSALASDMESGNWALRIAVALLVYLLVAGAFSPGFIALGVPLHSDLYRYFDIAHQPFTSDLLGNPRPLMLVMLRVLDIEDFRLFHSVLLVASLLLPVFMLAALERICRVRVGWTGTVAFLALCYVLPSFYELAPLDFGGALAGIIACIAAIVLAGGVAWTRVLAYALLAWISLEFKPNYAFVLCSLPLLLHWSDDRRGALAASASAFVVAVAVFLKDRWIGSAFVGVGAASGGSYQLLGQPMVVLEALGFYLQRLFSPFTWMLLLACAAWLAKNRQWKLIAGVGALALAAILPMLLIPNHRFVMYAWYPASILLLLVPLSAAAIPDLRWRPAWLVLLATGVLLACWAESRFLPLHRSWYVHNQRINANVLASLEQLRTRVVPGERVLISGRLSPYVPFKNDNMIARYMPHGAEWTVVAPPAEDALIPMSPNTTRYARMVDIDAAAFDKHVEYGADGRIDRIGPPDPALGASGDTPERRKLLFCSPAGTRDDNAIAACLGTIN